MRISEQELKANTRAPVNPENKFETRLYGVQGKLISSDTRLLDDIYAEHIFSKDGKSQKYMIRYTNFNVPANPHQRTRNQFDRHIIKSTALNDRLVAVSKKAFDAYLQFLSNGDIKLLDFIRREQYANN